MKYQSIYQLFQKVCAESATRPAYGYKRDGQWKELTWEQQRSRVARISKALMALGVQHGERVCILAASRLEWTQIDFGIMNAGAVTVGIYPSNLAADCAYILKHSGCRVLFVENAEQFDKIDSVRSELDLKHVVVIEGAADPARGGTSWDRFVGKADEISDDELHQRGAGIVPDDLASIVYTSGTTGVPKGVMLSHGNMLFTSWSVGQCLYLEPHFVMLMFLPLAHVYARLMVFCCMANANKICFAEDLSKVGENLREVQPHFIASVPRIYEKVYDRVISGARAAGGLRLKLFNWAVGIGMRVSRLKQDKQPVPFSLRTLDSIADRLVFKKIRAALGGRLVWAISGAAPLNPVIAEFFHACGLNVLEGIGMTENTSFTNVNQLDANKFGTVGRPGPGIEARIAEDGEVLFRGPNVMVGYYKDPQATAETVDPDGWLHTGDIGEIDDEGYLKITDRKKDLIITAGGKNIAPQRIERILRTSHYIAQVVAYGDKKKFISALISLEPEAIRKWSARNGLDSSSLEGLAAHPEVHELIAAEIAERNEQLASFESVKKFYIVPTDFSIERGELTPTLKVKRKVVVDRYRDRLNALYDG